VEKHLSSKSRISGEKSDRESSFAVDYDSLKPKILSIQTRNLDLPKKLEGLLQS
jgi:hypothetical protein